MMDRRKSLKIMATGAIAAGVIGVGCNSGEEQKKLVEEVLQSGEFTIDRMAEELAYEERLKKDGDFFTKEELATITVLADIIVPADEVSGSASDAKVTDFIAYIVKDMPEHQTPMRGGLRWLNLQSYNRFNKAFTAASKEEQLQLVDDIAYPEKAKPEMKQGVAFFNLMRNLVLTGFYTSEIGIKDLKYVGNAPNQWNGVPDEVLKQYGYAYTEKELAECVSFDNPTPIAE